MFDVGTCCLWLNFHASLRRPGPCDGWTDGCVQCFYRPRRSYVTTRRYAFFCSIYTASGRFDSLIPPCPRHSLLLSPRTLSVPTEVRSDLPEQGEGGGHRQGHRLPDLRVCERVRHQQQPSRVGGVKARKKRERESDRQSKNACSRCGEAQTTMGNICQCLKVALTPLP